MMTREAALKRMGEGCVDGLILLKQAFEAQVEFATLNAERYRADGPGFETTVEAYELCVKVFQETISAVEIVLEGFEMMDATLDQLHREATMRATKGETFTQ